VGLDSESRLREPAFPGKFHSISTVELAVKKVKKLSAPQARELLGWLVKKSDQRQSKGNKTRASTKGPDASQNAFSVRSIQVGCGVNPSLLVRRCAGLGKATSTERRVRGVIARL
jgi:hypothetical protein